IGPLKLTVVAPPATPTPVVTQMPAARTTDGGRAVDGAGGGDPIARWLLIGGVLLVGVLAGSAATWLVGRRARVALPPRRPDQTPADRARELQLTLERWWLDARSTKRGGDLETEMQELRSDLEAVRFAPGRADHSDTVVDLEARLRRLMRRA
ncbi:MAG: hypothetical protein AB1Z65_05645, partial [Candidatus Sulfomarinibacteraceae bacterium]